MQTIQFLSEDELFAAARDAAEGFTQKQIAAHLDCSQAAVSQMLSGEPNMTTLATRWLEMRMPVLDWQIETDTSGKPRRYFRAVSCEEAEG